MKIYESIKKIKRYRNGGFSKINPDLFMYSRKPELDKKYQNIVSWIIIEDRIKNPVRTAVLEISFFRKIHRTVPQWAKMWTEKTPFRSTDEKIRGQSYDRTKNQSLYEILERHILPNIRSRAAETDWHAISLIGWTHGISRYRGTVLSNRGNTTSKRRRS